LMESTTLYTPDCSFKRKSVAPREASVMMKRSILATLSASWKKWYMLIQKRQQENAFTSSIQDMRGKSQC
jgi:hypothetical protein